MIDQRINSPIIARTDPRPPLGGMLAIVMTLLALNASQVPTVEPSNGYNGTFVVLLTPTGIEVNGTPAQHHEMHSIFGPVPCAQPRVPRRARVEIYAHPNVQYQRLSEFLRILDLHCVVSSARLHIHTSQFRRQQTPSV